MNSKKYMWVGLLALFAVVGFSSATVGVDISAFGSLSTFKCLRESGFSFAIPRGFRSTNTLDPNVLANVANAWAAGFQHVDVYIFPCPKCGSPATQIQTLYDHLHRNGTRYGMIWLDIEGPQYWMGQEENRAFFSGMVSKAKSLGINIGIYTSASQWNPIMGSGYTAGSSFPLWYAHYDNSPSFSDFRPFGGWSKPAIKQYQGDVSLCGIGIDKSWYP